MHRKESEERDREVGRQEMETEAEIETEMGGRGGDGFQQVLDTMLAKMAATPNAHGCPSPIQGWLPFSKHKE